MERVHCEFSNETSRIISCLHNNIFNGIVFLVFGIILASICISISISIGFKMLSSKIDTQNDVLRELVNITKMQQEIERVGSK